MNGVFLWSFSLCFSLEPNLDANILPNTHAQTDACPVLQDAVVEAIPSCVSESRPALYDPIALWRTSGSSIWVSGFCFFCFYFLF